MHVEKLKIFHSSHIQQTELKLSHLSLPGQQDLPFDPRMK